MLLLERGFTDFTRMRVVRVRLLLSLLAACASLALLSTFRHTLFYSLRTTVDQSGDVIPSSWARRSRFCSQRPKVIIYNRVPKAGSSTALALLSRLSRQNQFTLVRTGEPWHNYSKVRIEIESALLRPGRTMICDHFNFPSILHEDIAYVNLLREPVSRVISEYYYVRYGRRPAARRSEALRVRGNMTLDSCIHQDDADRVKCLGSAKHISVSQSKYFCGRDGGSCSNLNRKQLHARAMNNMEMLIS